MAIMALAEAADPRAPFPRPVAYNYHVGRQHSRLIVVEGEVIDTGDNEPQ